MRLTIEPAVFFALSVFVQHAFAYVARSPSPTASAASPAFTYNNDSFLLNGEPFVIIGGQMDPQRVPAVFWRDRLQKARAMGLNTIFSYTYWNLLEPTPGSWTSNEPDNDIAKFFSIAHEEGLHVVLRPGPYICGEREWGGFPYWLSNIEGMVVRTYNQPFLAAAKTYLEKLAADLQSLQVSRGGPLLMVQVENEYGSYGENHEYTSAIRDILLDNFEVPLYTNDGGVQFTLEGGSVPGVLAEIDGDPSSGFNARNLYITDPSMLGPLLDGEYYTLAPDFWGSDNPHNTTEGRPGQVQQFVTDLDFVLGASNSISLYMFHGGSNFAFSNGAIWKGFTAAFTTSYDYGSPLDESGRTNELYTTLRDTIQKYVPQGSIPAPPANIERLEIPDFEPSPNATLFDNLGSKVQSTSPKSMEDLDQAYGLVFYEHTATDAVSGLVQPGDHARDRVIVYVNGVQKGVIDSTYREPVAVSVDLQTGDKLQLLVENLGRVDYWSRESGTYNALEDQRKGIVGNVSVAGSVLLDWDIYSLPLDAPPSTHEQAFKTGNSSGPVFYTGSFSVSDKLSDPMQRDTFIAVPNGIKGNVWVNGFSLGRYWVIGPQQSLYLPGNVVKCGDNEIVVLELEPTEKTMLVRGESERIWGNNPDPDFVQ